MSNRWLISFVASMSLHLAALVILGTFIHSNGNSLRRSAGLSDAPLTVSIAQPEKQKSAVVPSRLLASEQASRNSNVHSVMQNSVQVGMTSSQYMGFASNYFKTSELDVIPEIRRDIDLYPPELHNLGHGDGKVVLRLWIDENGSVVKVEPVNSDLPTIFAEAAARVFMQAEFRPGRKNGSAVKSRVETVLFYPSSSSNQ